MDFNKMSMDELKNYAKSIGLSFGNIGKEKLIEKIMAKESEKFVLQSIVEDSDFDETQSMNAENTESYNKESLVDSISSIIDDLDESEKSISDDVIEDIPITALIPVRSITFGGLIYKSRVNSAVFRWNQIGDEQIMTMADLNEMNNYKPEFLNNPLVILRDERAIKKFRLTKVYENVSKLSNLKALFSSNEKAIETAIDAAVSVNMRDILISKVSQMIKNRTLVNINVIRLLTRKLQYDFEEILDQNSV